MLSVKFGGSANSACRNWSCAVIAAVCVLAAGCGTETAKNTVTGKVTLGSDTVTGLILFKMPDGKEYSGLLTNGAYSATIDTTGEASITIKPDPNAPVAQAPPGGGDAPSPTTMPAMPGMPKAGVSPPAKYATEAGGLKYSVKAGSQTHDIQLTP